MTALAVGNARRPGDIVIVGLAITVAVNRGTGAGSITGRCTVIGVVDIHVLDHVDVSEAVVD